MLKDLSTVKDSCPTDIVVINHEIEKLKVKGILFLYRTESLYIEGQLKLRLQAL